MCLGILQHQTTQNNASNDRITEFLINTNLLNHPNQNHEKLPDTETNEWAIRSFSIVSGDPRIFSHEQSNFGRPLSKNDPKLSSFTSRGPRHIKQYEFTLE
ncbi:hypothetical protein M8J76_000493 [Diaphorina citri]|nr:hypothetical protein M8J76_000493 [Diaphorina citri]